MQIEGKNAVSESLDSELTINKLLIQNGQYDTASRNIIAKAKEKHIRFEFVNKSVLDKLSVTGKHQGFILDTSEFKYCELEDILENAKNKNEEPFVLILDDIEDPHNLGAIVRTCECAGVHGVVIPDRHACQVTETVARTSAGAINNVLISRVGNIKNAINYFKEQGLWLYAAEVGGEDIYKTNLKGPIAFIIGSEGYGTKPSVIKQADNVISLPLKGKINSLNASVAAGIVLFEALRQRSI